MPMEPPRRTGGTADLEHDEWLGGERRKRKRAEVTARLYVAMAGALLVGLFVAALHRDWMMTWTPAITLALLLLMISGARLIRDGVRWMRYAVWIGPFAYLATLCLSAAYQGPIPIDDLKKEGTVLVEILEEHRREHGMYPADLPQLSGPQRSDDFGGWSYRRLGLSYQLGVGDYGHDGFVLYFSPERGWSIARS